MNFKQNLNLHPDSTKLLPRYKITTTIIYTHKKVIVLPNCSISPFSDKYFHIACTSLHLE